MQPKPEPLTGKPQRGGKKHYKHRRKKNKKIVSLSPCDNCPYRHSPCFGFCLKELEEGSNI